MAWLKFIADYDYRLPSSTTDYKAGFVGNVKRECADLAVKAGAAVRIKTPRQGEEPEHG